MATITVKIDSEDLAREVLSHMGYLPDDEDIPDLISVDEDDEEEPETEPKTECAACKTAESVQ
jgi:hypothetical protein